MYLQVYEYMGVKFSPETEVLLTFVCWGQFRWRERQQLA